MNCEWLQETVSAKQHVPMKVLANLLGIHHNMLQYKLREMGLYQQFSSLSNLDLDCVIKIYKRLRPNSGIRYTIGFLRHHGLCIQKEHVREVLQHLDGLGVALRQHEALCRRDYVSHMSSTIWHMDGLHKLILWGWVVHAFTDGHDHMVCQS
jgi:hypothetical protein